MESIRLHFKMNNAKCMHKFRVTILLHQEDEQPQLLSVRTYDESAFAHATRPLPGEESRKKKKEEETEI